jgi:2-C-methyl-D-erythritol 4-phosphate cytidylyltransferase
VTAVTDVPHPRTAAVLLAGGAGTRVGADVNKVLLALAGEPVLAWSLKAIRSLPYVEHVVVVTRRQDRPFVEPLIGDETLIDGGRERHDSEWRALQVLAPSIEASELDVVAIHDAARPLASAGLWDAVVEAAARHGGALPAHRLDGMVSADGTVVRDAVGVQTPQAFRAADLLAAYRAADRDGFTGSDTASCLERYTDARIAAVMAPATNLKVTFPEDVELARWLLGLRAGGDPSGP